MKKLLILLFTTVLLTSQAFSAEKTHRIRLEVGPSISTELDSHSSAASDEKIDSALSVGLSYAYKNYLGGWNRTTFRGSFEENTIIGSSQVVADFDVTGYADVLKLGYLHFFSSTPWRLGGGLGLTVGGSAEVELDSLTVGGVSAVTNDSSDVDFNQPNGTSVFFEGGYDWEISGQTIDLFAQLQSNRWEFKKDDHKLTTSIVTLNLGAGYAW